LGSGQRIQHGERPDGAEEENPSRSGQKIAMRRKNKLRCMAICIFPSLLEKE